MQVSFTQVSMTRSADAKVLARWRGLHTIAHGACTAHTPVRKSMTSGSTIEHQRAQADGRGSGGAGEDVLPCPACCTAVRARAARAFTQHSQLHTVTAWLYPARVS